MSNEENDVLNRLINALLEGRVIPFIGAGISVEAEVDHELDLKESCSDVYQSLNGFSPTIEWMKGQLRGLLCKLLEEGELIATTSIGSVLRRKIDEMERGNDGVSFVELVELLSWYRSQRFLCEILRIQAFAHLKPTPAHYYLAWLMRENMVREIITTNYDTCLERAYLESIGKPPQAEDRTLKVIWNQKTYCSSSGVQLDHEFKPVHVIYKINGCARAYEKGDCDPHEILFTHRQLNGPGNVERQWAYGLLKDRIRRQGLFFIGFGSDEAQIRVTIQEVLLETKDVRQQYDQPWRAPNAPYFAIYDQPSFTQLELARSFFERHGVENSDSFAALNESIDNNFISTKHKPFSNAKNLSANLLLREIYKRLFCKLVYRFFAWDGLLRRWLRRNFYNSGQFVALVNEFLTNKLEDFLEWQPEWRLTRFHVWIASAKNPDAIFNRAHGKHTYISIIEEPVYVGVMLMMIAMLFRDIDVDGESLVINEGIGLMVKCDESQPSWFVLAHNDLDVHYLFYIENSLNATNGENSNNSLTQMEDWRPRFLIRVPGGQFFGQGVSYVKRIKHDSREYGSSVQSIRLISYREIDAVEWLALAIKAKEAQIGKQKKSSLLSISRLLVAKRARPSGYAYNLREKMQLVQRVE